MGEAQTFDEIHVDAIVDSPNKRSMQVVRQLLKFITYPRVTPFRSLGVQDPDPTTLSSTRTRLL